MLTHQVIQLGGPAKGFGVDQGDLLTTEGRRELFAVVHRHCPNLHLDEPDLWAMYSKWSMFSSQRSLQAWDQTQESRMLMLTQIALCLVLCRHQRRCGKHAHCEQPKGSLMMKLPQVQEVFRYMTTAQPDLCKAGDFQDPQRKQPIKKGLEINTTSMHTFKTLDPLSCEYSHQHQPIEGSTMFQGMRVSRFQFSELYPRKFAR